MANQNTTIDQVKAWLTPGLLTILSWFVIDLKNDVKVLLDRTARLEERVHEMEMQVDEARATVEAERKRAEWRTFGGEWE